MKKEFSKQPLSKIIILYILSLGLYFLYWHYHNWRYIKKNIVEFKNVNPLIKTLCLFIPIFNLFILYDFFDTIINMAKRKKVKVFVKPSGLILLMLLLSLLNYIHPVFFILNLMIIIKVQILLNKVISEKEVFSINKTEIIISIVGIILWIKIVF